MADPVLLERDGAIARVTLNRPEAFNAMNMELVSQFSEHLLALAQDAAVRGIVITGAGKAFCAGGDLKWALGFPNGPDAAFHALASKLHVAILEIRRMAKPVIAAVNGVAAGAGFTLSLACDFRVIAHSAVLRQAYTSAGLSIDGGGTFALPRLVGLARAMEIAAFDKPIPAHEALAWGLVTDVVDDGQAVERATAMAQDLAQRSLHSYGLSKQLLNDSFDTPLEAQLERERAALVACGRHPEGLEGMHAFAEKRKPDFVGASG